MLKRPNWQQCGERIRWCQKARGYGSGPRESDEVWNMTWEEE